MISTLNGWSCSTKKRAPPSGDSSLQLERMVGGDALAHPLLDRGQVVGRQRPGQLEVVVEAVIDDRPDPELRAGEQVEHRLGQDVRGGVAHRPELAGGAMIHELVGRAALGHLEGDRVLDLDRCVGRGSPAPGAVALLLAHVRRLLRITKPRVLRQDERLSPAVPPAFTTVVVHSWPR